MDRELDETRVLLTKELTDKTDELTQVLRTQDDLEDQLRKSLAHLDHLKAAKSDLESSFTTLQRDYDQLLREKRVNERQIQDLREEN